MAKSDSTDSNERAQLEQQIRDAEQRGDTAEADRLRTQVTGAEQQAGQPGNRTTQQEQ